MGRTSKESLATQQRSGDKLEDKSKDKSRSSRGCRECGGSHRTSKCPELAVKSSRRHRSRSRSPSRTERSKHADSRKSRSRVSRSPSPRHHHRHSRSTRTDHHHRSSAGGRSERPRSPSDRKAGSTRDRDARHAASNSRNDHHRGSQRTKDRADKPTLSPPSKDANKPGSSRKRSRRSGRRGGGCRDSARQASSSAIQATIPPSKEQQPLQPFQPQRQHEESQPQNTLETGLQNTLMNEMAQQPAPPQGISQMVDDIDADISEPDPLPDEKPQIEAPQKEPTPAQERQEQDCGNGSDQAEGEEGAMDNENEDGESSSHYSSSSQSSQEEEPNQDGDGEEAEAENESPKTLTHQQTGQPAKIAHNEDSVSSLFLSDKNANSQNFQGLKQAEGKLAQDDLDDLDKLSSPGKPRSKPKSINSPTMLQQNISQTNMLLQTLSQQQSQISLPPQIPSQQQANFINSTMPPQLSRPQNPKTPNRHQYGNPQRPQQQPHQQLPPPMQPNRQQAAPPRDNNPYRHQNQYQQQLPPQAPLGTNRNMLGINQQAPPPFNHGSGNQIYPQSQSYGVVNNNPSLMLNGQAPPANQSNFNMTANPMMGGNNPGEQTGGKPGMIGGLNLSNLGDLTNYEESVRRLEHTEGALAQKAVLRKCSIKGAKIDVRLFVGQVPRVWKDENIMNYFRKFGYILEARIIRDKYDGSHRGCAFLKCQNFHEAEDILDSHLPKVKNENGEFQDDPRRLQKQGGSRSARRLDYPAIDSQIAAPTDGNTLEDEKANDARIASRLQVRYADGELERLGIVNLETQEQSKLYCSHISKKLSQERVTELFQTFGDVEELYLFKDQGDNFRGSCFIKFSTRKQALKAVLYLNRKGQRDNKYAGALVDPDLDCVGFVGGNGQHQGGVPEGYPVLDIRFADKKRKENFSLIYQSQKNVQLLKNWQNQCQQTSVGGPPSQGYEGNHRHHHQGRNGNRGDQQTQFGGNRPHHHFNNEGHEAMAQPGFHRQQNRNSRYNNNNINQDYAPHQQSSSHFHANNNQSSHQSQQQQLMMGPLQVFLRSLLIDPNKQHLYLEYFSQENGGKAYYLDTHTNTSQWQKPPESQADPLTGQMTQSVILSGLQVNEQMKQWLQSADGQKAVAQYQSQQQASGQNSYGAENGTGAFNQGRQHSHRQGPSNNYSYNDQSAQQQRQTNYQDQQYQSSGGMQGQSQHQRAINLITQGLYKQGPVGANLFIFHLPNEWSDLDLFYFFESFKLGSIVSVRIMTDKQSGRSKGYGFVSYDNARSAEDAIRKVNGKQALGKRLKVELKKGGIATHLGGDVSLSKEDAQAIRRNMADESGSMHEWDSSQSASLMATVTQNNSIEGARQSQRAQPDSSQRLHSFATGGNKPQQSSREHRSATDHVMQQILGSNSTLPSSATKKSSSQLDSLASMTNLIYEGTTGANEDFESSEPVSQQRQHHRV